MHTVRSRVDTVKEPDMWRKRRLIMIAVLIFCFLCIGYILIRGVDTVTAQTTVSMSFMTIISIVGSYVFGATWEDINKINLKGRK